MDGSPLVDVVWEEHPCLVVNKPGGVLTQSPPGIESLVDRLRSFLTARDDGFDEESYMGVPHRLDRPASGAILFARSLRATRRICEQFQGRTVEKIYWVLVQGQVHPAAGVWEDFMRKIPGEARAEIVPHDHADARQAVLRYEVLRHEDFGTWLRVQLETGRTHQIRLQCAARGFPILGDALYGAAAKFGPCAPDPRARWIALHARSIGFSHPKSRARVVVQAPLLSPWLKVRPSEYWDTASQ